jgi:hypothetical protein
MQHDTEDPRVRLRALRAGKEGEGVAAATGDEVAAPEPETTSAPVAPSFQGSAMVGRYAQRTFRLPPDYLVQIRRLAAAEGISIAEAERWVVARGLVAYYEDGERPQFQRRARGRVRLPGRSEEA